MTATHLSTGFFHRRAGVLTILKPSNHQPAPVTATLPETHLLVSAGKLPARPSSGSGPSGYDGSKGTRDPGSTLRGQPTSFHSEVPVADVVK